MHSYEQLLDEARDNDLIVKEKILLANDGLIKDNRIAIRKDISTSTEKACVLAEELGHHYTTVGNILDMSNGNNRKQEHIARTWAYQKMISFEDMIQSFERGCRTGYELAEHLEVTEEFLADALEYFKQKHGQYIKVGDYTLIFYPHFDVMKSF